MRLSTGHSSIGQGRHSEISQSCTWPYLNDHKCEYLRSTRTTAQSVSRLNSCSTRFVHLKLNLLNMCSQQSVSILIINVYLPTDYGTIESTTTFHETIAELEGFLLTQSYDYIIMASW